MANIPGTSGPVEIPAKPEGGSDVTPLAYGSPDKVGAESASGDVTAQQGAGGPYLAPGAQGVASDGTAHKGWKGSAYSQGGPAILPAVPGLAALTPDPSHGRPEGGAVLPGSEPGEAVDPRLGDSQTGQELNPALKKALSPRPGPFGAPSENG